MGPLYGVRRLREYLEEIHPVPMPYPGCRGCEEERAKTNTKESI